MVGAIGGLLVLGAAVVAVLFVMILLDDPYDVDAWAAANPAAPPADVDQLPRLDWHPCPFADEDGGADVRCATLFVPESRFDGPPSGVASVAVAVLPATGPYRHDDPVIYLEGGPGESSVAWFDFWSEEGWPGMASRDLILIDQRGTGYSTPSLGCSEVYESGYDDEREALRDCHDRLVAEGIDLTAVSTREHAADVADLRIAMGIDEWNLFGVSYGTRVGLAVIDRYPDGVRSAVFDSVYPPEVDGLLEQNDAAYAAFDRLFDACAADTLCAEAHGDVAAKLDMAIDALDADPAHVDGFALYGTDLVFALFTAMYDTGFIGELPAVIADAALDPDRALEDLLGEELDSRPRVAPSRAVPAYDSSDGTFHSVECREEAAVTDIEATRERAGELPGPLGRALYEQLELQLEICATWTSGTATAEEKAPVHGDTPALLLAGGYDPVTPVSWARLAAGRLTRGQLVEFDAAGHAVFTVGGCVIDLIEGFLDAPGVQVDGAACAASYAEVTFSEGGMSSGARDNGDIQEERS